VDVRDLIDEALEITVVGSFTRLGYEARRRLYGWTDPRTDALAGRTALVTGPTSGIGRATADALAGLGARIILVGRSQERLQVVADALTTTHGEDRFPTVVADMSSLASVRGAVQIIRSSEPRLDVLIDSAGAIHAQRTTTADGLEATFATMVVGPFVLISGLLPLLEASGDGRVISVVSGGMYGQSLRLHDLQYEQGEFNGTLAYARAKRAATALTREWARRVQDRPIRFNTMHPGWADTPGLAEALPGFHGILGPLLRSPAQGIDTVAWLASDPDAGRKGGQLFLDRRPRPFDRVPATRLGPQQRRELWDAVVRLSGVPDPAPDPALLRT
jgi:dehydrogenase/reductase SDR family member 12